ncbi:hypothetical protein FDP22_06850 [Paroceanicella profunda]|uniref:Uncharacterized protein n=1 Tax=Paroceanicella profunda TaxID=2579971 RepID=A0A5B8FT23_9RHOB|nr:hypothetical protein [Paroceanicella profunda]QDL91525.1 hypothetical protein FDP22_06850 [Paroceanicella profunda]
MGFFSEKWSASGGSQFNEEYRREVLALDPKGKEDILRGSIQWLERMGVIDAGDVMKFYEITEARNSFAHENRKIISGEFLPNFGTLFPVLVALVTKIDRWWIFNVYVSNIYDSDNVDIELEEVTPGSTVFLNILEQIALGEDESAWALYRAFIIEPRAG